VTATKEQPGNDATTSRARATGEIRVLIVDDHQIFTDLLEFALNCEPGLTCVGKASGPEQARELYERLRPDAVVMDLQLGPGEAEGIAITRELVALDPDACVLVLTALKDHHLAIRAAEAGAVGFLQKDGSARTVINALRTVHDGYLMISPTVFSEIGRQLHLGMELSRPMLSERELEVLALIGRGVRPRLIAEQLEISAHTVKSHLAALKRKLETHTQLETVTKAIALGLIPSPGGDSA
jgi:DNA-binding NarL/FixJ family response regulator